MLSISLILILLTRIYISKSASLESCDSQSQCLSVSYTYGVEDVEICIMYNNTLPECTKNDNISHVCYNKNDTGKIEDFATESQMCLSASCDVENGFNFVEFGFKDGDECNSDGTGEYDILNAFDAECRAADILSNPENPDILCHGGNSDECIHKIYYDPSACLPPPVNPEDDDQSGQNGDSVPTCQDQAPCLEINYYPNMETNEMAICVIYDSQNEECNKPDDEAISHLCYNGIQEDNVVNGAEYCMTVSCIAAIEEDAMDHYVEFGAKDSQGCANGGDTVYINGGLNDGFIDCYPADNGFNKVCNGNNIECIYKIYYDIDQCINVEDYALINSNKKGNKNMFGMENASTTETFSIWSGIIIGVVIIMVLIAGLIKFYVVNKRKSNEITIQLPNDPNQIKIEETHQNTETININQDVEDEDESIAI